MPSCCKSLPFIALAEEISGALSCPFFEKASSAFLAIGFKLSGNCGS